MCKLDFAALPSRATDYFSCYLVFQALWLKPSLLLVFGTGRRGRQSIDHHRGAFVMLDLGSTST